MHLSVQICIPGKVQGQIWCYFFCCCSHTGGVRKQAVSFNLIVASYQFRIWTPPPLAGKAEKSPSLCFFFWEDYDLSLKNLIRLCVGRAPSRQLCTSNLYSLSLSHIHTKTFLSPLSLFQKRIMANLERVNPLQWSVFYQNQLEQKNTAFVSALDFYPSKTESHVHS